MFGALLGLAGGGAGGGEGSMGPNSSLDSRTSATAGNISIGGLNIGTQKMGTETKILIGAGLLAVVLVAYKI